MIPTVIRQVRKIPVTTENLGAWTRDELIPFLAEVRQALNYTDIIQANYITAATNTFTSIWTSTDVAVGQSILVSAMVTAVGTPFASAFKITGLFFNGGTFAQEGVTFADYTQTTAAFAVQFSVSGNKVSLQVEDDGATTVTWRAIISVLELQG